jgi:hypothetical protein
MTHRAPWHESMEATADPPLPTSWAFGPYRKGQGGESDHYRLRYACQALKDVLYDDFGYTSIDTSNSKLGNAADAAIRDFQGTHGLVVDGEAGAKTCFAIFTEVIFDAEDQFGVPGHWLAAHGYWESGAFDPGAELVNGDGSRDRGLFQDNDLHGPYTLTDAQAFDPHVTIPRRANAMSVFALARLGKYCTINDAGILRKFWAWPIAVSSFRAPRGAQELCEEGDTPVDPIRPFDQPGYPDDINWEQACAYYILRIRGVKRALFQ